MEQSDGYGPVMALTVSLILAVCGSLRDWVSPAGYWAAWGAWAVLALAVTWHVRDARARIRPPGGVMASYAVLVVGMLLSAAFNHDGVSAYQAAKIAVIALLFMVMWRLVLCLQWRHLVTAMQWAMAAVLVGLMVSRFWNPTGHVLQEGAREGSFLAVYGVLWKAGAFFLPVFLADAVETPAAWVRHGVMVAACVFVVLIDGSRTGLLLVAATGIGFVVFLLWRGGWGVLRRLRWLGAALAVLLVLQILNAGSVGGLFTTRLGAGDPERLKLLHASLQQVVPCQPLGCGFGKTGTAIADVPLMAVHNAYLAALGDFGVLGLVGMLGFLAAAVWPVVRVLRVGDRSAQGLFVVATAGSAVAYGMALMLNTFTTEMSEWGFLIVMLAFAWAPGRGVSFLLRGEDVGDGQKE